MSERIADAEAAYRGQQPILGRGSDRYRQLFEDMGHGVIYLDKQGRITDANPAAERILGVPRNELRGVSALDPRWGSVREDGSPIPSEERPGVLTLRTGVQDRDTVLGIVRPGQREPRWYLVSTLPERAEDGTVVGAVTFLDDITDRKRMEDERASLLERERRARREAQRAVTLVHRIQSITDASLGYLPFDEFLHELLRRIRDALQVDAATLFLTSPSGDELVMRASVGVDDQAPADARIAVGDGFAGRVASSGRTMVAEDASSLRLVGGPAVTRAGSVAGVPLRVDGQLIGVFRVLSWVRRTFDRDDLHLLELVTARIASAVQRARIWDEREQMGRALQASLLPSTPPKIPGIELAFRYFPASEGNQVGGDFYDAFELPGGSTAVVIGDVCGKGPSAAANMGIARHALRAIGLRQSRPSSILSTLNDLLIREYEGSTFLTACLIRLKARQHGIRATISSGGHPLPLHLSEGRVEVVGRPGTLLGVFEAQLYDTAIDLSLGDVLVLYTDGLMERPGQGQSGFDRLVRLLQGCRDLGLEEITERIDELTAEGATDDRAWVVLRAVGPGASDIG